MLKTKSLGDASPDRDLLVSPDHAFLLQVEALVKAKTMVKGKSILYHDTEEARGFYYHIELENHDREDVGRLRTI